MLESWDGKIEFMLECKLCYKLNDDDEENHVAHKKSSSHQRVNETGGNDFSQSALATQTQIVWRKSTPSISFGEKSENDDTETFERAGIS